MIGAMTTYRGGMFRKSGFAAAKKNVLADVQAIASQQRELEFAGT